MNHLDLMLKRNKTPRFRGTRRPPSSEAATTQSYGTATCAPVPIRSGSKTRLS